MNIEKKGQIVLIAGFIVLAVLAAYFMGIITFAFEGTTLYTFLDSTVISPNENPKLVYGLYLQKDTDKTIFESDSYKQGTVVVFLDSLVPENVVAQVPMYLEGGDDYSRRYADAVLPYEGLAKHGAGTHTLLFAIARMQHLSNGTMTEYGRPTGFQGTTNRMIGNDMYFFESYPTADKEIYIENSTGNSGGGGSGGIPPIPDSTDFFANIWAWILSWFGGG